MFEGLFCTAFGHRYVVERVLNQGARKVGCTRCGKQWAMHDATRSFVQWDSDLESLYAPGAFTANTKNGMSCQSEHIGLAVCEAYNTLKGHPRRGNE